MQHRIELSTVLLIAVRSTEGMKPVQRFKQEATENFLGQQKINSIAKSKKICVDAQGNMVAIAGNELVTV